MSVPFLLGRLPITTVRRHCIKIYARVPTDVTQSLSRASTTDILVEISTVEDVGTLGCNRGHPDWDSCIARCTSDFWIKPPCRSWMPLAAYTFHVQMEPRYR